VAVTLVGVLGSTFASEISALSAFLNTMLVATGVTRAFVGCRCRRWAKAGVANEQIITGTRNLASEERSEVIFFSSGVNYGFCFSK
jgi:hypothetical protein